MAADEQGCRDAAAALCRTLAQGLDLLYGLVRGPFHLFSPPRSVESAQEMHPVHALFQSPEPANGYENAWPFFQMGGGASSRDFQVGFLCLRRRIPYW